MSTGTGTLASSSAVIPPEVISPAREEARRRTLIRRGSIYLVATILAVWILLPIWLVTTMAFSTPTQVYSFPKPFLPSPVSTETLRFFFNVQGILSSTLNSLLVAVLALLISTLIAMPAGYAIARFVFPGRDVIRLGILAVRAFPIVVLAVPLAVVFINLGIFDNPISLALMHAALTLPTTTLIIASVFASVPVEYEEAAQVFGSTSFQAFRQVVFPLSVPGIAASAILTFVLSWNEVFASTLLTSQNRTLPAEILYALNKSTDPFKFAAAFFMMVPSLVFIFFIRRYLFNLYGTFNK